MINHTQLTKAEQEHFQHTIQQVNEWSKANIPIDYYYASKATCWAKALSAGVINKDMFDYAAQRFGNLWTYVGD